MFFSAQKTFPAIRIVLIILLFVFILTQLQPWIVAQAGGVAGSFGVRAVSHKCLGFTLENRSLPPGEMEFTLLRFHFRYSVTNDVSRPFCLGQDIWLGE